MEIIGKVAAILDGTKLLLKLHKRPSTGAVLTIFSEVSSPKLQELGLELERIYFPKGDVSVLMDQDGEYFLAQRFQSERIEKRRKPSNFMASPLSQLLGEEEIEVVTKGAWSASFDSSQSLNVEYPKEIQIGDAVGTK